MAATIVYHKLLVQISEKHHLILPACITFALWNLARYFQLLETIKAYSKPPTTVDCFPDYTDTKLTNFKNAVYM